MTSRDNPLPSGDKPFFKTSYFCITKQKTNVMKKLFFSSLVLFITLSASASEYDSLAVNEKSVEIIHSAHNYIRVLYQPIEKGSVYIKISDHKDRIVHRNYLNYKRCPSISYDTSKLAKGKYKIEVFRKGKLLSTKEFSIRTNTTVHQAFPSQEHLAITSK